ncbi:hypothetical protein C0991_006332 [Blastosporella zonata]|nr:hypothetical protein C0991_006332 [Blastosporella zonata]
MSVKNNAGHTGFAPSYHSPGLKKQLNDWIQDGGQEKTFFDLNVVRETLPGVPVEHEIHVKLTTKGIRKFEIDIGDWHVSGVKTLYPKRKRGAPNALDPKYARPISFLLAYDPKLKVEITQLNGDGDQNATTTSASDDKPYVTVLGILGKHFSPNASN